MGKIVSQVATFFLMIALCFSMVFVAKKHKSLVCKDIEVVIKAYPEQSFITPKEIIDLLQSTTAIVLQKTPLEKINIYAIQQQLNSHPLIKEVLIYKTWNGTLKIALETKYFIARIVKPFSKKIGDKQLSSESFTDAQPCVDLFDNHKDLSTKNSGLEKIELSNRAINQVKQTSSQIYVDEAGEIIQLQGVQIPRVLVITGQDITTEKSKIGYKGLLILLQHISKDAFWQQQITSLEVRNNGKVILGTQVGRHQIEFGYPEHINKKFEKLALFYKQVIPYKGWDAYHRINVEFEDQLICE